MDINQVVESVRDVGGNWSQAMKALKDGSGMTLTVGKFGSRLMRTGMSYRSGKLYNCGLNGASTICSGASLGCQTVAYYTGKANPKASLYFYVAAQGFSIAADTIDNSLGVNSYLF
jgi:hypothetical protein